MRARQRMVATGTVAAALIAAAVGFAIEWRGRPVHAPAAAAPASAAPAAPSSATPLVPMEPAKVAADPSVHAAEGAMTPLEKTMRAVPITMYGRDSSDCTRARTWLARGGYTFKERNVDADPTAQASWKKIAPDGVVPAFDVEGQTFAGFDPDRIRAALSYSAARRLQR